MKGAVEDVKRNSRLTICILSLSEISSDPRVRRQGDALVEAGFSVFGVGLSDNKFIAGGWSVLREVSKPGGREKEVPPRVDSFFRRAGLRCVSALEVPKTMLEGLGSIDSISLFRRWTEAFSHAVLAICRKWVRAYYRAKSKLIMHARKYAVARILVLFTSLSGLRTMFRIISIPVARKNALKEYWSWQKSKELYAAAERITAAVWIANDWTTLPVAARLARERGGSYFYDTHEFAVNEYNERLDWRLLRRPLVRAIEGQLIHDAKVTTVVSQRIADAIAKIYDLSTVPAVVRNMPYYEQVTFRPTGKHIKVLYHGILAKTRGLEAAIDSVKLWRPGISLTLRGGGDPRYVAELNTRITENNLTDRVFIVEPVPMMDLVKEAAAFDIGLFSLPPTSLHNQFALPNKFFEYVMAGLAVCVTDLPEMRDLIQKYGIGLTFPDIKPTSIAEVINRFDRLSIDQFKKRSMTAAAELCWEQESIRMLNVYSAAIGPA